MDAPVIELDGVGVDYGGVAALDAIQHRFAPCTSTAVMGANGSGKTTLLDVLAGLRPPSRGTVRGLDPARVGYVVQHLTARWLPITVGEVLAMGRYRRLGLWRRIGAADRAALHGAAERLAIGDLLHRQFSELSGGQRQRVRIAQVLAGEPDVLLLDEPITGLDLPSQKVILDVISELAADGVTIVVTTHHLDEARHCDQVLLLAVRRVAAGPPDEVLTAARLREAFGGRILGDHADHDHEHDLLVLDDHGHGDAH
jgi:ABC-type Mn2+/Zn2+ transport system ATPase subunit